MIIRLDVSIGLPALTRREAILVDKAILANKYL